ncbi:MAG: DUF1926 domain-containing protein, partial [Chrysiogenetes bacterium]|nr:DUF1926 domain-containing protein [Chrysiogenetes bacterium]
RWRESYHSGADITHKSSDSDGVASPHEHAVGIEKEALADYHFDKLPLRSLREFTAEHAPGAAGLGAFAGMNRANAPLKDWRIEGAGFVGSGSAGGARFEKRVAFESKTRLACAWKIQEIEKNACFGVMLCLSLLTPEAPGRTLVIESAGKTHEVIPGSALDPLAASAFVLRDTHIGFALRVEFTGSGALLSTAPVETLQRSENAFERVYQGTIFSLCWDAATLAKLGDAPSLSLEFLSEDAK